MITRFAHNLVAALVLLVMLCCAIEGHYLPVLMYVVMLASVLTIFKVGH